ncbi:MAG: GNAT family N-acetyltransferase [Candidatus Bipolaricaulota bacterium]|nr:GNAT family N-acetyltransferase [Candidatus Bipolaricaulota bacterium]
MPIRALRLPHDQGQAVDVLIRAFQYPDHAEWSVHGDDKPRLLAQMRQSCAPGVVGEMVRWLCPAFRDVALGCVWEESGKIHGLALAERENEATLWTLGTVAVLPESRRRGIASQLIEATLDLMRRRGGTRVRLGVVDGNTPAQALYRSLGFVEYASWARYSLTPHGSVGCPSVPVGYKEEPMRQSCWRTLYEFERRIVPADIQEFEPVTPGRYKTPTASRALAAIFGLTQMSHDEGVLLRRAYHGDVVARVWWSPGGQSGGTSEVRMRLDPEHGRLASYAVRRALSGVVDRAPAVRVEAFALSWMPTVGVELELLGFCRRTCNKSMGRRL